MTDEPFNAWRAREIAAGHRCDPVCGIVYGGPTRWHSFVAGGPERGKVMSAFIKVPADDWSRIGPSRELELK